jgi:ubiquinone/menaquinone biosynthesis C-methylase UbiE
LDTVSSLSSVLTATKLDALTLGSIPALLTYLKSNLMEKIPMKSTFDFFTVTEIPGQKATAEQMSMLSTRYKLALDHADNQDVLEVACGSGIGLGYLSSMARSVTGGDIDAKNLAIAKSNYQHNPKVKVLEFNAQDFPFDDDSFDLVLLFEAIYYIPDVTSFLKETFRVLRPSGRLIIASVNCKWESFNPSPFSVKYYSYDDLTIMLTQMGFDTRVFAGYPESSSGFVKKIVQRIRILAVKLNLIPKTMGGKALFKRLFYGKLKFLPSQLEPGMGQLESLVEVTRSSQASNYKVLYFLASKPT